MKAFKTISALLLASLVLVSSTSFTIGMHFCMGEVKNIALFSKADGCEMEKKLPPCHRQTKTSCCDDQTVVHEGDDFKASIADLHFEVSLAPVIDQPLILISEIIPSSAIFRFQYYNYDPPLRSYDLTVAHQVFLI